MEVGWVGDAHLCFPPVDLRDTGTSLLLASVEVSNRIVAFVPQSSHLILGLKESCARPLFVSAKLK
jgi:hypothetical protein